MNHAAKYDEQKLLFGGDTMAKVAWKCEFWGRKKGCGLCFGGAVVWREGITSLLLVVGTLPMFGFYPKLLQPGQKWQNFENGKKMNVSQASQGNRRKREIERASQV